MKLAVLSGKGGTGKTFISVNLASVSPGSVYADCDVEEPNGHLFFKPEIIEIKEIAVKIPEIEKDKCDGCRICTDFCRFNALAYINNNIKVFDEVCHSCGGCSILCPHNAISEKYKAIGKTETGNSEGINVISGFLNPGEASGVPIIKNIIESISEKNDMTVIDCPPGSACTVMESIKDSDFCLLVAEPTTFGVHNLNMVYELVTLFNKPFAVVLNKCMDGFNPSEDFCIRNNIPILEKIPFTKELGILNSEGIIASRYSEKYHQLFSNLLYKIKEEVKI